jgi:hypothetical protein
VDTYLLCVSDVRFVNCKFFGSSQQVLRIPGTLASL